MSRHDRHPRSSRSIAGMALALLLGLLPALASAQCCLEIMCFQDLPPEQCWGMLTDSCQPYPCGAPEPIGACCTFSGCAIGPLWGCELFGGSYQGDGSTCSASTCPTGACCQPGGCSITPSFACNAFDAIYQGDGSSCADVTGACCTETGCQELSADGCRGAGGIFSGDCTSCSSAPCTSWHGTEPLPNPQVPVPTLLPDGRVLFGTSFPPVIYDPMAAQFTPTAFPPALWAGGVASLLANGRVLVASETFAPVAAIYDPVANNWSLTNPPAPAGSPSGGWLNVATRLSDGRVLVLGRDANLSPVAKLYDPATESWSLTAAPAVDHEVATLLEDGRVLATGCSEATSLACNTAELFDPASGTWAPTGDLALGRLGHTATLLGDGSGRVLVAGTHPQSELFDPASGNWSLGGVMGSSRSRHSASLLGDGRVLVAGGFDSVGTLNTTEIYDPATDRWAPGRPLREGRWDHASTLLPDGRVLVAGGRGAFDTISTTELFDPSGGQWTATTALPDPRERHSATLLEDGQVLIAGGFAPGEPLPSQCELFSPLSQSWSHTGALLTPRHSHSATLLPDGRVLVAGGLDGASTTLASGELYDPSARIWSATGALQEARWAQATVRLADGRVLVAGGRSGGGLAGGWTYLASSEIYDPASATWTLTGALTEPCGSLCSLTLLADGRVLLSALRPQLYDPEAGTWSTVADLAAPETSGPAITLDSNQVLLVGDGSQVYWPLPGTWVPTGSFGSARQGATLTLLLNGDALLSGGDRGAGEPVFTAAELHHPGSGTWRFTGSLNEARSRHTATLLADGRVLVAGGSPDAGLSALASAELYDSATPFNASRRPIITSISGPLAHGAPVTITGSRFRSRSAAGGGIAKTSDVRHGLVRLRSLSSDRTYQVAAAAPDCSPAPPGLCDYPDSELVIERLPADLAPGQYFLEVIAAGVPSEPRLVQAPCSPSIATSPQDQRVVLGQDATFAVDAPGGVRYQWQRDPSGQGAWEDVDGATGPTLSWRTGLADVDGTRYRVIVHTLCTAPLVSAPATLSIELPPTGTCCSGDASACQLLYEFQCADIGGFYGGDNTTCAADTCALGACCLDGSCFIMRRQDCDASSGKFQGENVSCDASPCEVGACCTGDDCQLLDLADCRDAGGVWAGASTTCVSEPCSWSSTGALEKRSVPVLTLLADGRVLAVESGQICEIYDPATGRWTRTGDTQRPRIDQGFPWAVTSLLGDGRVLLLGGDDDPLTPTAEVYDPRSGTWSLTGSPIATAGAARVATLLADGRVLVLSQDEAQAPVAQLFDPATGSWSLSGAPASNHDVATRLEDGRVLATGCARNMGNNCTLVELFDPASGSWIIAGDTGDPRFAHTATLLADGSGRVLLAGPEQQAELYDPATGLVTPAGTMARKRMQASASLLADGRVLVTGGFNPENRTVLRTTEIYDPATNTWSESRPLRERRFDHASALLPDGRVLIAGGGDSSNFRLRSAELFDAHSGRWTTTGTMSFPRQGHRAVLLETGQVLVAGGIAAGGYRPAETELYDPVGGSWTLTGSMTESRLAPAATLLADGRVLVAGGRDPDDQALGSAEIFDPVSGTWSATGALNEPRWGHAAARMADGRVLLSGGASGASVGYQVVASSEVYDPATGTWSFTGATPQPCGTCPLGLLDDGRVLQAGPSASVYDPASGTWSSAGAPIDPQVAGAVRLHDGQVLLVSLGAQLYDPATNAWSLTGGPNLSRTEGSLTLLLDGEALVAGGAAAVEDRVWAAAELYHPGSHSWRLTGGLNVPRRRHSATLLADGRVLVAGGTARRDIENPDSLASAELYESSTPFDPDRRPLVTSVSGPFAYGGTVTITGSRFRSTSAADGSTASTSAARHGLVRLRNLSTNRAYWVAPALPNCSPGPPGSCDFPDSELVVDRLPPGLMPGAYFLQVVVAGVPSEPQLVHVLCSPAIAASPQDQSVVLGQTATFSVSAPGGLRYQWQRDSTGQGAWVDVPGARGSSLTTAPVGPDDVGSRYRVIVHSDCAAPLVSDAARVTVEDAIPPTNVTVVSPSGGEYWLVSTATAASQQVVSWSMSDNIRVCQVAAELLYSDDAGLSYKSAPAGGGLPATFGTPGACPFPGEATSSLIYTVPKAPPSGKPGSLYKIRVTVTDHAGNATEAESANPFFIVEPNLDGVQTLILANVPRMQSVQGMSPSEAESLTRRLGELARHPQVIGTIIDLSGASELQQLFACWDCARDGSCTGDKVDANAVLFGSEAGACGPNALDGIQGYLVKQLYPVYTGVRNLVIVGDDRIFPMARVPDRTSVQLSENVYAGGPDLTTDGTTVGVALSDNDFLSDDPLAQSYAVPALDLASHIMFPDRNVGRLVETPREIEHTIATFISQGGLLDVTALDPDTGHKVLVMGYDFLSDTSRLIRERWKAFFGKPTDVTSRWPVDGTLIGGNWEMPCGASERSDELERHLAGNDLCCSDPCTPGTCSACPGSDGTRYAILSLNGHANHHQEGVPGTDPFDIQGLPTSRLAALDLTGSVIYSVGCHSALPVTGSDPVDADHSLDLPQTALAAGAVAYVGNAGFGWGLKEGPPGYAERLAQLMTEELTQGGTVSIGDAVRSAKLQYFGQSPRLDAFDKKTLMQWTLFGLPMYEVRLGSPPRVRSAEAPGLWRGEPRALPAGKTSAVTERLGAVGVARDVPAFGPQTSSALPPFLTQVNLTFDLSADGVYRKFKADGTEIPLDAVCADIAPSDVGCYYTLNGVIERSSGQSDLPAEPYLVYDSRLSGTSQHGVLWKGGSFVQEDGWVPVFSELQSNGGDFSNHGAIGSSLQTRAIGSSLQTRAIGQHGTPGQDPNGCAPSDQELNSLVLSTGEAVANPATSKFDIHRLFRRADTEVLYYNNTLSGAGNCDREGPALAAGPFGGKYHRLNGSGELEWAVPASDVEGDVWRVLIVYQDGRLENGVGQWLPLELVADGSGTWRGSIPSAGIGRLLYLVQAADTHGNVTTVQFVTPPGEEPASGIPYEIPDVVPVDITKVVSVGDTGVAEGPCTGLEATFPVTLSSPGTGVVEVTYATSDGSASAGRDYTAASGTLSFAAGETSKTVRVPVLRDGITEPDETFFLDLSAPVNATIAGGRGTATIDNVDPTFRDVRVDNPFYLFIEALASAAITGGCSASPPLYCPTQVVSREQMAVFVLRALGVAPNSAGLPRFDDVPTTSFAYGHIQTFATLGITSGCAPRRYCPGDPVTRSQMAVFLIRALGETPAACPGRFSDVPGSHPFCGYIERFAQLGITQGCGPGIYCPDAPVTRDQMAAFLVRAFELSLPPPCGASRVHVRHGLQPGVAPEGTPPGNEEPGTDPSAPGGGTLDYEAHGAVSLPTGRIRRGTPAPGRRALPRPAH